MVNPELKKYIEETRQQGFSDSMIHQELIKAGWIEDNIKEALTMTGSLSNLHNYTISYQKTIIIIIILLIVFGASAMLWLNKPNYTSATINARCKNESYGFEFMYPADWKVWKPGPPEARAATCAEVLHIYAFAKDLFGIPFKNRINLEINTRDNQTAVFWAGVNSLDDYIAKLNLPIKKETKLDNERLVWLSIGSALASETERLITYHNGAIFIFSVFSVDDTTLNKIISSFKFIKSSNQIVEDLPNTNIQNCGIIDMGVIDIYKPIEGSNKNSIGCINKAILNCSSATVEVVGVATSTLKVIGKENDNCIIESKASKPIVHPVDSFEYYTVCKFPIDKFINYLDAGYKKLGKGEDWLWLALSFIKGDDKATPENDGWFMNEVILGSDNYVKYECK